MDKEEFGRRFTAIGQKAYSLALRLLGNGAEAEDAVQDVYEKMWRRREWLSRCENPEAFMMQTARNCCYDVLRHRRVVRARQAEAVTEARHDGLAPLPGEGSDVMRIVEQAIATLPPRQKEAIHLRDVMQYEFDEIATIMGCDVPTVRVYLSRGRKAAAETIRKTEEYGTHRQNT